MPKTILTEPYPIGAVLAWQTMNNVAPWSLTDRQNISAWDYFGGICTDSSSAHADSHIYIEVPEREIWEIEVTATIQLVTTGLGSEREGYFALLLKNTSSDQLVSAMYSSSIDATKRQGTSLSFSTTFRNLSDVYGPYKVVLNWDPTSTGTNVKIGPDDYLGNGGAMLHPEHVNMTVKLINRFRRDWN